MPGRPAARSVAHSLPPAAVLCYASRWPAAAFLPRLQVPACVVLSALAAYHAAVVDIEDRHVGVRVCCYPADIDGRERGMIASKTWPPQLQEK